ncbi:MAG: ribbon-helix-helix protein, CopG family [Euryarchaeota archaeon]|nr:ribbon-helix-helix protein, CopG family [Euryarchaeota archaeon]
MSVVVPSFRLSKDLAGKLAVLERKMSFRNRAELMRAALREFLLRNRDLLDEESPVDRLWGLSGAPRPPDDPKRVAREALADAALRR